MERAYTRSDSRQGRGGSGYQRGGQGRGGSSRGRGAPVTFANRNNALSLLCKRNEGEKALGWKEPKNNELSKLPKRKEYNLPPKDYCIKEQVKIVVNHFPVKINLPKLLYLYRVDIERLKDNDEPSQHHRKSQPHVSQYDEQHQQAMLPAFLRKAILQHLQPILTREFGQKYGIITDFSAAIYSVIKLEPANRPLIIHVQGSSIKNLDEKFESVYRVRITDTHEILDTSNLAGIINNMKGIAPTNLNLEQIEMIYSTLFRNVRLSMFTPMRRSDLIRYEQEPHQLGGGLVSYSGYNVQMPLMNGWKKFINIEIANIATYLSKPVLDVLQSFFADDRRIVPSDVSTWREDHVKKASEFFRSCKVSYTPQAGKTFSKVVVCVCRESVSKLFFDFSGRQISVYDYYNFQYGIRLKNKNGPCLECKGGGSPKIPAEICTLKAGQSFSRKLNDKQTTNMAKTARLSPAELHPAISKAVTELQLQNNELFGPYGLELLNGGKMHEISARVLTPPELCYGKKTGTADNSQRGVIVPEDGVWDIWNTEFEFFSGVNIEKWGILNLSPFWQGKPQVTKESAMDFAWKLKEKAKQKSLVFPKPCHYHELNLQDDPVAWKKNCDLLTKSLRDFKEKFENKSVSFVMVILPTKGCSIYNHLKQAAELSVGILTQCIIGRNMTDPKRLDSILGNLLLKINSKLNKINHVILAPPKFPQCFSVFNNPVLIIGADVTHPPPGSTRIITKSDKDGNSIKVEEGPPSFAAVTCSIDRTMMPYMMHVQAQKKSGMGAAEVISGFEQIVLKFIHTFKEKTGTVPVKIIYFRDGVGCAQFQEVLQTEMIAMRQACTEFGKSVLKINNYQPRITFVVVQKRHKTRFFMPSYNSFENALPGTVIDTDIVHPDETDFYLLSHKGLMGTSRPTRYHVLWDDSDFSMNEIQVLAYILCYMFVRCNHSVKIPAPTYYSHWAAKRAEILSKGWGDNLVGENGIAEINQKLGAEATVKEFRSLYPMHFV